MNSPVMNRYLMNRSLMNRSMRRADAFRKFVRFLFIYGIGRSLFKAAGRMRITIPILDLAACPPDIGLIGCGQYGFATIGYFILTTYGKRIAACYDTDAQAQATLAKALGVKHAANSVAELLANPALKRVYIASNHASHTDYAIAALQRGLDVYVEKPVSVSRDQVMRLVAAANASDAKIYAGYNRPFSAAIHDLKKNMTINPAGGMSLQCFVSGHKIEAGHWYRRPEEGTRICGNAGHWLDLMVHLWGWRGFPDLLDISVMSADRQEPDDNLCITISSDRGDIFSLMMTSRCEPFEGINETINFQHDETICKIDDFRAMTIWQASKRIQKRYWPKDVGHRHAILQPFIKGMQRDWSEVIMSTLVMLHIVDMLRTRQNHAQLSLTQTMAALMSDAKSSAASV